MTTTASSSALETLQRHMGVLTDLEHIASLLEWDQQTHMPAGAAEARAGQLASLRRLVHERLTDERLGQWLDETQRQQHDEDTEVMLQLTRRHYEREQKIPADFLEEYIRLCSQAQHIWARARQNDAFADFAPTLERIVDMSRRRADYLGYDDHPYDALHDLYERGSTVARLNRVFDELRQDIVPLIVNISSHGRDISDALLQQHYDENQQEAFALEAVRRFGYSFEHGRLDRTVHPFAISMSKYDVRITTRYDPQNLAMALFGTMHEAGHGMYEQGIADRYQRSILAESASLGVHESQSRLWENIIGRSYSYWQYAYPALQTRFPEQLSAVPLDLFYAAINKVSPSFIRVEADEVTYNVHIMIRYELELALIEGSLKVRDLPEAWNSKYQQYLGITPPNDRLGCLQDVHWAAGLIGYFPTYSLGNIMSMQLFEAAVARHPSIEEDMQQGDFALLLTWLRDNIHQHGCKYTPEALLQRATGQALQAKPYLRYLKNKFGNLYRV